MAPPEWTSDCSLLLLIVFVAILEYAKTAVLNVLHVLLGRNFVCGLPTLKLKDIKPKS